MAGSGRDIYNPVAETVPYDDTVQTPLSGAEDVQAVIDWLKNRVMVSSSPGFTWGRSGNVNQNTWFLNDSVPSIISGRTNFLLNAKIEKIYIANEDPTAGIEIEIYTHDGNSVNLLLVGAVTTAAVRSNTFTVSISIPLNKQIALKASASSAGGKNMVVGCLIRGDTA